MQALLINVLIAIVALGLLALQYVLSRLRIAWLGLILPSAWIAACLVGWLMGNLSGFRGCAVSVIGFAGLLGLWRDGRRHRGAREQ
jgi:hypothetical protein